MQIGLAVTDQHSALEAVRLWWIVSISLSDFRNSIASRAKKRLWLPAVLCCTLLSKSHSILESKRLSPRPLAVKNRHHGFLWKILQGQATSTLSSTVVVTSGGAIPSLDESQENALEGRKLDVLFAKETHKSAMMAPPPPSLLAATELLPLPPAGFSWRTAHVLAHAMIPHISPWSHTSPVRVSLQVQTSGKHKPTMLPSIATSKR